MFEDAFELLDHIANPIASDSGTREVTRKETKIKMIRQCVKGHRVKADKESCDQGDDYMENLEETKKCCLKHPLIKDSELQRWREYNGIDLRDQADIILFDIPGTHMLKKKAGNGYARENKRH